MENSPVWLFNVEKVAEDPQNDSFVKIYLENFVFLFLKHRHEKTCKS